MPSPEPGAPGIFAMADPDRVRALVVDAGFAEPEIEFTRMNWSFADFDSYWDFLVRLAGALAVTIRRLPPEEQNAVRSLVHERLAAATGGPDLQLAGMTLNAATS
jgi:hypothetical protein